MKIVNFFKQDHFPSAALSKSLNTHCSTPLSCRRHASHQKQPSVLSNQHRGSHKWTSGSLTLLPSPHEMKDLGVTSFIGCPIAHCPFTQPSLRASCFNSPASNLVTNFSHFHMVLTSPSNLITSWKGNGVEIIKLTVHVPMSSGKYWTFWIRCHWRHQRLLHSTWLFRHSSTLLPANVQASPILLQMLLHSAYWSKFSQSSSHH